MELSESEVSFPVQKSPEFLKTVNFSFVFVSCSQTPFVSSVTVTKAGILAIHLVPHLHITEQGTLKGNR